MVRVRKKQTLGVGWCFGTFLVAISGGFEGMVSGPLLGGLKTPFGTQKANLGGWKGGVGPFLKTISGRPGGVGF